ncbi:MAG: hypothetical protein IJQ47_07280, partial [Synergistaceae bacterium]|nr:hypothetical protein [Synergistaceae bacterium]
MNVLEELENLRREAYVKAVIRKSESDDVVGYVGMNLPVDIFYERGLMAIPVYGIDEEILKFSVEKDLCPLIDATITYAKTDKCPLIHSSKLIVIENFCPIFTRELQKLKNKQIYVYNGNNEELKSKLNEVYGEMLTPPSHFVSHLPASEEAVNATFPKSTLAKGRCHACMTERLNTTGRCLTETERLKQEVNTVKYFLNFLAPSERSEFLERISDG